MPVPVLSVLHVLILKSSEKPLREVQLLSPNYRWVNQGPGGPSHLSKATQQACSKTRIWILICCSQHYMIFTTTSVLFKLFDSKTQPEIYFYHHSVDTYITESKLPTATHLSHGYFNIIFYSIFIIIIVIVIIITNVGCDQLKLFPAH